MRTAHPILTAGEVAELIRSTPAARAFQVATSDVLVWIAGVAICKTGQRRRVLEFLLNAPAHCATHRDLKEIASQYGARVKELRSAGFKIEWRPLKAEKGQGYFQFVLTDDEGRAIRCGLAIAGRLRKFQQDEALDHHQPQRTQPIEKQRRFGFMALGANFASHGRVVAS